MQDLTNSNPIKVQIDLMINVKQNAVLFTLTCALHWHWKCNQKFGWYNVSSIFCVKYFEKISNHNFSVTPEN